MEEILLRTKLPETGISPRGTQFTDHAGSGLSTATGLSVDP
jgi:hypothetical protein